MTIVHRFTFLEWFNALRDHLAGVSVIEDMISIESSSKRNVRKVFIEIVKLKTGEALLFSLFAILDAKIDGSHATADLKKQNEKSKLHDNVMSQKLELD